MRAGSRGAGKTTTIRMLTHQLRPKSDRAMVRGQDVAGHAQQVQAQIEACFEETNPYEQMSAEKNLKLFTRLSGVQDFDAGALLARVGLPGREKDRVESYSKGLKQRLMVARALANRPRILFVNEPTEGLDPISAEAIRHIIRSLDDVVVVTS